ncbi:MAG TPA: hypothetical protein PLZ44_08165 [Methanothrix sp.]|nr:hypothetical protein [Methanothrix sp.]
MSNKQMMRLTFLGLCAVISIIACSMSGLGMGFGNNSQQADSGHQVSPSMSDLYGAMAGTYSSVETPSALDRAVALHAIQKLYGSNGAFSQDNWGYWMNIWLNSE